MRSLVGRALRGRAAPRRIAASALSAVLALGLVSGAAPARAEDGGLFGFLRTALGGGESAPAPAAPPPMASQGEQVRPLIVRRAPKKATRTPGTGRARLARLPARTGPVSIYEDPTLRSGDAVMTKDGMKVFAGGRFSPDHPYADGDFIAVSAAKTVAPEMRKTVIELNKLPHG